MQELDVSLLHVAALCNHQNQTGSLLANDADANITDAWVSQNCFTLFAFP